MRLETGFDMVADTQAAYRVILHAFARPGRIGRLDGSRLNPPPGLTRAAAVVALTLFDRDARFHAFEGDETVRAWIRANTGVTESEIEEAGFVLADGQAPSLAAELPFGGDLLYPETAATFILQVRGLFPRPSAGAVSVSLEGPGVNGTQTVWIAGLNEEIFHTVRRRNAEFPLGLDVLLCSDDDGSGHSCVVGIARSSQIRTGRA